jgi:hypothetical protein
VSRGLLNLEDRTSTGIPIQDPTAKPCQFVVRTRQYSYRTSPVYAQRPGGAVIEKLDHLRGKKSEAHGSGRGRSFGSHWKHVRIH